MKLAMIADDLTGANDSGVQLARYGLNTSVLFEPDVTAIHQEAVVIDTDSRWLPRSQAYDKVKEVSQVLKSGSFDVIYKKVDSTLRGNLGAEIDALYEVFRPDFVVIAPAYPKNGRKTIDGYHYLHEKPLSETEIAKDPKTPVRDSFIPSIIQSQSEQPIALVTYEELRSGLEAVQAKLIQCQEDGIRYVVFDAEEEEDLRRIVQTMARIGRSVCWVGSAGLANYLPEIYGLQTKEIELDIQRDQKPVLLVVGSVSPTTRKQLDIVVQQPHIKGIELRSSLLVADNASRKAEMQRVYEEAKRALDDRHDIALFSSGRPEDIEEAQRLGKKNGMDESAVSNSISGALGTVTSWLIEACEIKGMVLTGGDTAKQVCMQLGVTGFHLIAEVEIGIPLGRTIGAKPMYAITKAGAFGTDLSLLNSIQKLKGE
ncbi:MULTISPECIES: four-carbon acid sugar kinase family protein [unclassified Paenibacillus]|uniref:four-carbon acid sugar kinase family protein n=1 Tax=unclassified Paenibacillus TaxID=185978 RepID=UPI001AE936D8|nr:MULTISPECIES: four-carbon acid sugar kinase family protein [unclassified Paenibacillus]MBP1153326.1 uncharacterized protein YgbK (DUF1537 family) [Paenibacillus sp. PvP091]MBP1171291.1 uncharacterized protein YgbK (DUF1537 family) [Paenibacillus sp. PvR098]MBP2442319.1 uncharacterized protein YgbK (DUF1537 family) [Paenibacillus sp. PvP052]